MKENKKLFIGSACCFVLFIIFTLLVKNVGVMPVGPQNSEVGFASVNKAVSDSLPYNDFMYNLSEVLGYIAILSVAFFGLFGIMQLFIKKGFSKVDKDLYILCGLYAGVLACYILFEKIIINYRPVILDEGLEASYPSSHTMLTICTMSVAMMQITRRVIDGRIKTLLISLCTLIMAGTLIGRVLSGVHWLTDIIGALLLSVALVYTYRMVLKSE